MGAKRIRRWMSRSALVVIGAVFLSISYAPATYAACGGESGGSSGGGGWSLAPSSPSPASPHSRLPFYNMGNYSYMYPIGGVSLDQAATFLGDMKDVTGAYFDQTSNRIVFIGKKNTGTPVFNKDDLAVAIRAVVFNNSIPQVSIGNGMQSPMPVYYFGGIENTNMGAVLESADYQLKKYLFGFTASGQPVSSSSPGYQSLRDRYAAIGPTPGSASISRYWISPKQMNLKQDSATGSFVFDQATMQLQTEAMSASNDPKWNQVSTDFVQQFTAHYDWYAQENPIYERTRELAKLVSVVKWMKDNNIASDYNWAKNYTPNYVPTPTTEPWITSPPTTTSNGLQLSLSGGVSFDTPNAYVADNGQASTLKSAAQSAAPGTESSHWEFNQSGQQYTALAVSANAFRSVGAYGTMATDMVLPAEGDYDLHFSRTYNSLTTGQNGVGRGWSWLPAQMTNLQPWNSTYCAPAGGYAGNYPVKIAYQTLDGGYETFTYNCGSGYVPDKPEFHTRIVRNSDGSFSAYAKDNSYFKFGGDFVLWFHRDRNDNGVYYQYDGTPNVTRITDDYDHQLTIQRDGGGMITGVRDWTNRTVSYGYDGQGNLVSVTDPKGGVLHYGYDSVNRLNSIVDRQGRQLLTQAYNDESKVGTSTTGAGGASITNTYDTTNRIVTTTDNGQRVSKTHYDDKARITKQIDPNNYFVAYTYGTEPSPLTVTDKRLNTTSYTYDPGGNMTSATYPNNKQVTYQYNAQNRVTQISDGRYGITPKVTSFTYDAAGNNLTKTEAGITTTNTYDDSGQLLSAKNALNNTWHFEYDEYGNKTEESNPTGATTQYAYDAVRRLAAQTDPTGRSKSFTYDANNNVLTVTDASGTVTNAYSADNKLVSATLPGGQVTQFAYNALGSQTSTTDAANSLTAYGYDQYQNILSRQDALSHTTQYAYDKLDRKTQETTPLGKVSKWEYDANGNISKRIDASNRETLYSYDNLNRLTQVTYPNTTTVTNTYDDRGNLKQMVGPNGATTFAYDNLDRLTSETDPNNATIAYQYDNASNMTRITYPDNKQVNYTFDTANRLKTITDWNSSQTVYQYNTNGTLASKQLPNGVAAAYTYDGSNRLASLQYTKNQQMITRYTYTRDGRGNVTKEVESAPSAAASYVVFDEVLRSGWSKSWSWDSTISLTDTAAPYAGTKDISWKVDGAWGGLHLRSTGGMLNIAPYNVLSFAMKAASGTNHTMSVNLKDQNDNDISAPVDIGLYGGYPTASGHKVYNIPLSAFGSTATQISGLSFEDNTGQAQPKVYIDDVKFTTATATPITLFADSLLPTLMDWSWGTTNNFADTVPFLGAKSIGVTYTEAWGGLGIQSEEGFSPTAYESLTFALKGSASGQDFGVEATNAEGEGIGQGLSIVPYGGTPDGNGFVSYTVPLTDLQLPAGKVYGLMFQDYTGAPQPKIYIDEIKLTPKVATVTTDKEANFTYDALGRVITATYPGKTYTYAYDAVGNRTASNENGTAKTYTYNNDNQLTAQGSRTFTYDNQGNELTDGQKNLVYDFDNRLTSFTNPTTSQTIGFVYDAAGNRIKKNVNGTPTFQYANDLSGDLSRVLVAKNVTNNAQTYYVYGSSMLSQGGATAASRQYYLDDGLGNVRYITDNAGTSLQAYQYDPYGNQITGSNVSNYSFQQQQNDYETGLTYLRARYYDPTTGRFISKDPIAGFLTDPQTQNGYSYASNDPVNLRDPSGMVVDTIWDIGNVLYDVWTCDWGALAYDGAAVFIPFLPAGLSKGTKILKFGDEARNMNKASNDVITKLQKNGYDIHALKKEVGGDSKHDIFQDSKGDLYVNLKNGSGEPQPLHINVKNLR